MIFCNLSEAIVSEFSNEGTATAVFL
jgi:hypothetical protein